MKRRLLVLTPRLPYPMLAGDAIRIYQICAALSRDWEITLVTLCQSGREMAQVLPPDAPFTHVHRVLLPRWKSCLQAALAVFSGEALQIAYYRSKPFERAVRRLHAGQDAVLCHLLRTAPYANGFVGIRWLELTDHLPLTYRRTRALKGSHMGLLGMAYSIEGARMARTQKHYSAQFDQISFVSSIDRQAFLLETRTPPDRVISIPVGVDLDQRPFTPGRSGWKLAFIGNLRTLQNRDAIVFFIREVLPRIRERAPQVSLKVVGAVTPGFAAEFGQPGDIEFLGVVSSVADSVADCVVGVCPIRIAAGMQNKVLDYMSLGIPVATTAYGAEGLGAQHEAHALVADSAELFADNVLKLLMDAELRERLAASARRMIEAQFAVEVNAGRLREAFAASRGFRGAGRSATLAFPPDLQ